MERNNKHRVGIEYNPLCMIIGEPTIANGTWIGYHTLIDGSGGLKIGSGCNISSGVHIYTHDTVRRCHEGIEFNGDGSKNRDAIDYKPVRIGNNVFIGANAVILKGVTIGDRAVVGAGSIVQVGTQIGAGELWVGNPARFVRIWDDRSGARTHDVIQG